MTLLDRHMSAYSLRQVDRILVVADPERAWRAVRDVDLYQLGIARALFGLRGLPDRVLARVRRAPTPAAQTARIDDFTGPGRGFQILDEAAGRELVIGSIGAFWKPSIPFVEVERDRFAAFAEPGWGKLAYALRVDPAVRGGSWITFDLRVDATDRASWAKFRRYWWLIGRFSHLIRRQLLGWFERELGAAPDDTGRALAGDDLLAHAHFQRTHAITIDAPPARVWPWLVQMGCRRAGWYSWDRLDNGGIPSADHIVPELQHIAVGDHIPATPKGDAEFAVLRVDPGRALVLGSPTLLGEAPSPHAPPWTTTWSFVLEPIGDDATRLHVRARAGYQPTIELSLVAGVMGALHEVMERRQLRNLRVRAESRAA